MPAQGGEVVIRHLGDNWMARGLNGLLFSGPIWFVAKATFFLFVQIWIRWTLPRVRIDQVLYACVQVLLPLTMFLLLGEAERQATCVECQIQAAVVVDPHLLAPGVTMALVHASDVPFATALFAGICTHGARVAVGVMPEIAPVRAAAVVVDKIDDRDSVALRCAKVGASGAGVADAWVRIVTFGQVRLAGGGGIAGLALFHDGVAANRFAVCIQEGIAAGRAAAVPIGALGDDLLGAGQ